MILNVANVLGLLVACLVVRTSVAVRPDEGTSQAAAGSSSNMEEKLKHLFRELKEESTKPVAVTPNQINYLQAKMFDDHKSQQVCKGITKIEECEKCALDNKAPFYLFQKGKKCITYTRGSTYFNNIDKFTLTKKFMNKIKDMEGEELLKCIETNIGKKIKNNLDSLKKRNNNEGTSQAAAGSDNGQEFQWQPTSWAGEKDLNIVHDEDGYLLEQQSTFELPEMVPDLLAYQGSGMHQGDWSASVYQGVGMSQGEPATAGWQGESFYNNHLATKASSSGSDGTYLGFSEPQKSNFGDLSRQQRAEDQFFLPGSKFIGHPQAPPDTPAYIFDAYQGDEVEDHEERLQSEEPAQRSGMQQGVPASPEMLYYWDPQKEAFFTDIQPSGSSSNENLTQEDNVKSKKARWSSSKKS